MEFIIGLFIVAVTFGAGIPAWVAYALTGDAETARLAACWGGFGTAEILLLWGIFAAVNDEFWFSLVACGFLGCLLGVCACGHYFMITGRIVETLAFARITLATAFTGVICPIFAVLWKEKLSPTFRKKHIFR